MFVCVCVCVCVKKVFHLSSPGLIRKISCRSLHTHKLTQTQTHTQTHTHTHTHTHTQLISQLNTAGVICMCQGQCSPAERELVQFYFESLSRCIRKPFISCHWSHDTFTGHLSCIAEGANPGSTSPFAGPEFVFTFN